MSEPTNTVNISKDVNQKSKPNPEIHTAGDNLEIHTKDIHEILNPFLALERISVHLHEVNEILESMENELVEYRKCVTYQLLPNTEVHDDPKIKLWWEQQIQIEMKNFYYNTSHCLKILCFNFCERNNHYCNR